MKTSLFVASVLASIAFITAHGVAGSRLAPDGVNTITEHKDGTESTTALFVPKLKSSVEPWMVYEHSYVTNGIAIGGGASCVSESIALGNGAKATKPNQIAFMVNGKELVYDASEGDRKAFKRWIEAVLAECVKMEKKEGN
jgi:hypothetical protein